MCCLEIHLLLKREEVLNGQFFPLNHTRSVRQPVLPTVDAQEQESHIFLFSYMLKQMKIQKWYINKFNTNNGGINASNNKKDLYYYVTAHFLFLTANH